jgi:glycolate oxidase iron-sulfur subunit
MNWAPDAGLDACTRCGLCLQACPTYRDLRLEADSPRGRVFSMKQVADGFFEVDASLAEHLYVCLGCRACETACPSGVPFGRLLEQGRFQVEQSGEVDPSRRGWRVFRRILFEWLLPNRTAFLAAMAPAVWLQRRPALAKWASRLPMPARLRDALAMIPGSHRKHADRLPALIPALGERRARVGLFVGCVMGALFQHVHEALIRVLSHNGCEVVVPRGQWCCGALNVHAGERRRAQEMARRNIGVFEAAGVDAIVLDSAGCGCAMKEYAPLLADDPAFAQRAATLAAMVKDASEFLVTLGPRSDFGRIERRVTYQDACHLAHGQGIRKQPRALLALVPGLELVEMPDAERCCGAAGIYAMTHPDMAGRILEEKMINIEATGAQTAIVTNPGCHMQLLAGIRRRNSGIGVHHLVEVLDEAYRAAQS